MPYATSGEKTRIPVQVEGFEVGAYGIPVALEDALDDEHKVVIERDHSPDRAIPSTSSAIRCIVSLRSED